MSPSSTTFARHAVRTAALLALAGFGLSAGVAANAPVSAPTVAVPAQWQHTATSSALDTAALTEWWHRFNDPTLDALVARALQASPDLRSALAKIDEARARHGVQRATALPSVSGSVSSSGRRVTERHTNVSTTSESASASLDASWQIDLFGQQRAGLQATAADLAASEENFRAAQVSLAAEVASAYVTLRSTEAQLAVVRETIGTLEENLQFTRWQEQAGTGSALDTQQALSTLEQTRASVPSLELTLTETRNQIAVLCGQTPGALDALLGATGQVPSTPAALAVGIPAETLRQRPDVRAASRSLEAAMARTTAAKRDRYPTLSLSGSLGVDALRAGKLFSPESSFASLLGGLTLPIFASGKITQTIQVQLATEKQTLAAYESTILTALSEVENALVAVDRYQERLAALGRAAAAANETYTLARLRYQAGSVDFLTVLDAQRSLLSVRQSEVTTTASLTTAHVQLYKALGGGWTSQI